MLMSLVSLVIAAAPAQGPLHCPIMGHPVSKASAVFVYNGARIETCCAGCDAPFAKEPAKALKNEKMKGKALGLFLFDPVSGKRLEAKNAAGFAEHNGIRYPFESAANKATFEADPKKFGGWVEKEALYCPVMKHDLKGVAESGGFVDFEKTRYYVCCPNCLADARKNIATLAKEASSKAKPAKAVQVKA